MAGVQAGRLSIEIVAEIARLQQDLDKAKRAVKSMSGEIARDTKAANDNIARLGTGFQRTGERITASAGAQRAGMQQLTMQIGDMATMYALGARPMQIFASQSAQVIGALQLMSGGTSKFAAFMGGPWGAAITAGTLVLAPFVAKLFEAEEAAKKVEWASYKLSDAQSILGSVIDLTTGKINTQSKALLALARAQLAAGQIEARRQQAEARSEMVGIRKGKVELQGGMGGGLRFVRTGDASAGIVTAFQEGSLSIKEAERGLRSLMETGQITEKSYLEAAAAVTKFGVAAENIKVFDEAGRALDGDTKALAQFLDPKKPGRTPKGRKGRKGPSAAEIEARFAREMEGWTQRNLQAQMDLATSVEERVELQKRSVEWDRKGNLAEVAAQKDFSEEQKQRLVNMIEANNALRLEIIERDRVREIEKQEADLAQIRFDWQHTLLQQAADLADTQEERKQLALEILTIEQEYRRSQLEQVIASKATTDAEKKRAQLILDGLSAIEAGERRGVSRNNETAVERYLRDINKTPAQINEAIDGIKIDGLDSLNDGLVDAIMGVRSLGDVFKNVAAQIIADLLRIQIQRAIIGPLAKALGLGLGIGGSGPTDLLAGTPFGGGRATGGSVRSGTGYIVGEEGPEWFQPNTSGTIIPNHALGGGETVIRITLDSQMLHATVEEGAARVVVQSAPAIMKGAASQTLKAINRPPLG